MARRSKLPPTTKLEDLTVFRYSNYDTPFWARSNTQPGRWHVPGEGAVQYLSLSSDGTWAELLRNENLRSEDEAALVRMPLWTASVNQAMVVDYRDFSTADAAGFAAEALVDDDWERCQDEGRRLRDLGFKGVLAPCAALPGEVNLTLFGPRVAATWQSSPALVSFIPARIVTTGAPPPGLTDRVRYVGEAHAGLQEFLAAKTRRRES
jgi:RES domain-containing protein